MSQILFVPLSSPDEGGANRRLQTSLLVGINLHRSMFLKSTFGFFTGSCWLDLPRPWMGGLMHLLSILGLDEGCMEFDPLSAIIFG
jgi:hypothetical protein